MKLKLVLVGLLVCCCAAGGLGAWSMVYFGLADAAPKQPVFELGSVQTFEECYKDVKHVAWMEKGYRMEFLDAKENNVDGIVEFTEDGAFRVVGLGNGFIRLTSKIDATVVMTLEFHAVLSGKNLETVVRKNLDKTPETFVTKEELETLTILNVEDTAELDIEKLAYYERIHTLMIGNHPLDPDNYVKILNPDKVTRVSFVVPQELYAGYCTESTLAPAANRVFPFMNAKPDLQISLVLYPTGGKLPQSETLLETYNIAVNRGETVQLSAMEPFKIGYTFLGWYASEDGGVTYGQKLDDKYEFEQNVKAYARYRVNNYRVTYDVNGGENAVEQQEIAYDQEVQLRGNLPSKTGYTFQGWSDGREGSALYQPGQTVLNLTATDGGLIALSAVWAANSYKITYVANALNVEDVPAAQEDLKYDANVVLSSLVPSRTGYRFLGWALSETATDAQFQPGQTVSNLVSETGDVRLYAVWAANEYEVTFDANGGANAPAALQAQFNTELTLPTQKPSREGYTFLGWAKKQSAVSADYSAGAIVSGLASTQGTVVTLFAVWRANRYTVAYDLNGGSGALAVQTFTYDVVSALHAATPSKMGHTFQYWEREETLYNAAQSVKNLTASDGMKIILKAVWKANEYKIKFDANGGKNAPSEMTVTYGKAFSIPSQKPTRKDCDFLGWHLTQYTGSKDSLPSGGYKSGEATTRHPGGDTDAILYAVWKAKECVAEGTLITLADGTQRAVETLTGDERLLVWNLTTGAYDSAPILFIDSDSVSEYEIINLHFSNGTVVKVISEHGFWDLDLNRYVFLDASAAQYIGHWFYQQGTDARGDLAMTRVQLVDVVITTEQTTAWSPVTFGHLCYFVNGMLSMPGGTTGLINIFEVDAVTTKIDEAKLEADIDRYGLFTYEEFAQMLPVPEVIFEAFGGKYLKVAMGKGLTDLDTLADLIETYSKFF